MRFYLEGPGGISGMKQASDVRTTKAVTFEGNVTVLGTLSAAQEATAQVITSASANAFTVGPNGATNPGFNVDASVASAATGVTVQGQAAGGGVKIFATSSNTNEALNIDAKGAGVINIGATSTGQINLDNNTTVAGSLQATTTLALLTATAPAAGGSIGMRIGSSGSNGPQIVVGSGAPTISAAQGSLYLRTDGSSTSTRAYINNSSGSGTSWTALTTAA